LIDAVFNLYASMINPDKMLDYEYRDVSEEIAETVRRINGRISVESELWANIVELNMYEYEDPCIDLCICTPLDKPPTDCLDT